MSNVPAEIYLLRRVAAAAEWVIESNADDPVGRDGRARFGINAMMANGALAMALSALREHYDTTLLKPMFVDERARAAEIQSQLRRRA